MENTEKVASGLQHVVTGAMQIPRCLLVALQLHFSFFCMNNIHHQIRYHPLAHDGSSKMEGPKIVTTTPTSKAHHASSDGSTSASGSAGLGFNPQ